MTEPSCKEAQVSRNPNGVIGFTVYENVALTTETTEELIQYAITLIGATLETFMALGISRKGVYIPISAVPFSIQHAMVRTGMPITKFNSCLVMAYNGGAGFRPHFDSLKHFGDEIAAFTFGIPDSTVNFSAVTKFMAKRHGVPATDHAKVSVPMRLPAIWVMSGPARNGWMHSVGSIPKDSKRPRISFIFRTVITA
jgi:hypothetical protein